MAAIFIRNLPPIRMAIERSYYTSKAVIPTETLPIITKPVYLTKRITQKRENIRQKDEHKHKREQDRKQKDLIISCKNKKLNMYDGDHYSKFDQVPLASLGWNNKKSAGDSFVIHGSGKNPAILGDGSTFENLVSNPQILKALDDMGFKEPTNIQGLSIPVITRGSNTLIAAETGNGKTLAYLVPLLQQLTTLQIEDLPDNSPLLLVITPGKELAVQIANVCKDLCRELGLSVKLLLGGERTKKKMLHPKMCQQHVLVASFGALSKLVSTGVIRLSHLRHLVMDEADTLLDDSFNDHLTRFLRKIPIRNIDDPSSGVQLVLAGATLPLSLDTILRGIVETDSLERVFTKTLHCIMPHVSQRFFRLNSTMKVDKIVEMALDANAKKTPTIIFSKTADTVDWLGLTLLEKNIKCIHVGGNIESLARRTLYKEFVDGEHNIMCCTDVVSRGLDTVRAQHVINYDFPQYVSDYIHRCGRVGRIGSGNSLITNFVRKVEEVELLKRIEYAVRRDEPLHNVNANIARILKGIVSKNDERELIKKRKKESAKNFKNMLSNMH